MLAARENPLDKGRDSLDVAEIKSSGNQMMGSAALRDMMQSRRADEPSGMSDATFTILVQATDHRR